MFWTLILIGGFLEVLGDYFFKKESYPIGLVAYLCGAVFWALSLRYESLSKAVILFGVTNALISVAIGIHWLEESLSFQQWMGVILGATAIALI
jgi:multidrug transporter EmrE-like cation transporter